MDTLTKAGFTAIGIAAMIFFAGIHGSGWAVLAALGVGFACLALSVLRYLFR